MKKFNDFPNLILFLGISQMAGVIGSLFTMSEIGTWYATLVRPDIAPPSWVFGPVWTTLFLLMGIASYIVWRKGFKVGPNGKKPDADKQKKSKKALTIFGIQLVLNILWSVFFFGMHNLGGAFIEIIVLWISIVATTIYFTRISKTAGRLMLPYIAWVTFAAILNYSYFLLNK
jgi:tryptophan-rich sensory protein